MKEEWRAIVIEKNGVQYDYTGLYEVSNLGNVRTLNYRNTGKVKELKKSEDKDGYLFVTLKKDNERNTFKVHRLVAMVFIKNENSKDKTQVNHIDFNRQNNVVGNLEWVTPHENVYHAWNANEQRAEKRKYKTSEAHKGTKLSEEHRCKISNSKIKHRVLCIETNMIFNGLVEASKWCNAYKESIMRCCQGKQKTACGYHWKYME